MRTCMRELYTIVLVCIALLLLVATARADSLFEKYSRKSESDLTAETHEMGRALQQAFNAKDIGRRQMQIDFSEYRSNLKKALYYAKSLTSYSDYERDLAFARDKEIFQGLPEVREDTARENPLGPRRIFMQKKYARMEQNVQEEIGTYTDLLALSLDACEALTFQDLSGFVANEEHREAMRDFMLGEAVRAYEERRNRLAGRWPEIAERLSAQLRIWEGQATGPNDPILDPALVRALR